MSCAAVEVGLVDAPPLDLSASRKYNLEDFRLLEWALFMTFMISEGRFPSFLLEPPCTSFSPAASKGDQRKPFRSLILLRGGRRH